MKGLNRKSHEFNRHWFGSAPELTQRDNTATSRSLLFGCPDHAVLPHCLPVRNPMSFLIVQFVGITIPEVHDPAAVAVSEILNKAFCTYDVSDLIICTHTNCAIFEGWLKAPANSRLRFGCEQTHPTLKFIDHWYPDVFEMEKFGLFLREHILLQLEHLILYDAVRCRLEASELKLHCWLFDDLSRRIRAFDPLMGEFVSVDSDALSSR